MEKSLKLIKSQLQNILTRLTWTTAPQPVQNNVQLHLITNLNQLRFVITDLQSLGLFEETISKLVNSAIFTTSNDSIRVQATDNLAIVSELSLLKSLVINFLDVLKSTVPEESPESINIKLPPVNDFDELSKVSREIHLALTQVIYNDEINGQTKIVSVENGSIWLNVFVGATAVTVIASLIWSAAVTYKKILEGKLLEEQIRGLKVKNDSLEDILKSQKASTDLLIQVEAEHVNSEHFDINNPENIEKIKNSITIFAELIGKGAEIHPSLVAPENVANLFPDPTKLIGLESKIKRLANE